VKRKKSSWGAEPANGWTDGQKRRWEAEVKAKEDMEERVKQAVADFKRDRGRCPKSKKTAEAIKAMEIKPNSEVVDKIAARVVAARGLSGRRAGARKLRQSWATRP
jgi:hypothetical protein